MLAWVRNIFLPGYLVKRFLYVRYGLEKWHVNPLRARPYAVELIKYLNGRFGGQQKSVIEIGCGLGDIVRDLDFSERFGYDLHENVIAAARLISSFDKRPRTKFEVLAFPAPLHERVDCIMLVNWVHHIEPDALKAGIARYFNDNLRPGGELIVDTVSDPDYRHNHDIDFLSSGLPCSVFLIGNFERGRKIFAIRKTG